MKKYLLSITFSLFLVSNSFAQKTMLDILDRKDLTFEQIKVLADGFLENRTDTLQLKRDKKHYERWKYERKFHIDKKGYFISPLEEEKTFKANIKTSALSVASSWVEVGPKSFTSTSSYAPGVGRIDGLAVQATNTNVIYAASPGGGLWKTTNGGTTWTPLLDGYAAYMKVVDVVIDPSNSNTVYACTQGAGVIKSINGGSNWTATGTTDLFPLKVLIHPTNPSKVYATSASGIYESSNGGSTWTLRLSGVSVEDIEFKADDRTILFASGNSAIATTIHRSTDGGITWTAITSGITNSGRTLLGVSPADAKVVYAVQANGDLFGRMYKSIDGGLTFTTTVIGNSASGTNYFGYEGTGTTGQATYDMAIAVNPNNVNDLSIGGIIVWRSIDGGTTFTQKTAWTYPNTTGYNHADIQALEYVGNTLYSGSDGGVYKTDYSTTGSSSWTDISTGLGVKMVYRIANSHSNGIVLGGGSQDNGTFARQAGGNFVDWVAADSGEMIIDPTNPLRMIGTQQYGTIYLSTDGGNTNSLLTAPGDGAWVTPIAWHPTLSATVYGAWGEVYKSTNTGTTWTNISTTITSTEKFEQLAIAPSNDQYIYASKGSILWVTTNGGTSWTSYNYPSTITDIEVKYNTPQKVWITTAANTQNVLLSTNSGATFTDISTGLPSIAARSIAVDDFSSEGLFVAMNIGVYYRNLANPTWVLLGTGLPQVAINEIEISKIGGKIRVGTFGRGVWEINSPSCPLTLVYAAISQPAGTYQAAQTITSQAIVGTPTNYYAGQKITFSNGFRANLNTTFKAKIQACN